MYVISVMALDRSERNVLRDRWRGIKHDILACVSSGGATLRFFTLGRTILYLYIEEGAPSFSDHISLLDPP